MGFSFGLRSYIETRDGGCGERACGGVGMCVGFMSNLWGVGGRSGSVRGIWSLALSRAVHRPVLDLLLGEAHGRLVAGVGDAVYGLLYADLHLRSLCQIHPLSIYDARLTMLPMGFTGCC